MGEGRVELVVTREMVAIAAPVGVVLAASLLSRALLRGTSHTDTVAAALVLDAQRSARAAVNGKAPHVALMNICTASAHLHAARSLVDDTALTQVSGVDIPTAVATVDRCRRDIVKRVTRHHIATK
jgi:hypothetical protein